MLNVCIERAEIESGRTARKRGRNTLSGRRLAPLKSKSGLEWATRRADQFVLPVSTTLSLSCQKVVASRHVNRRSDGSFL